MHGPPKELFLLALLLASCDDTGPHPALESRPASSTSGNEAVSATPGPSSTFSARPMMIALSRDFCLPCQVMAPWVVELRRQHASTVDVVQLNVDRERNHHFALFFRADSVPSLIFVEASGRIVATREGVVAKQDMERTFRRLGWIR